MFEVGLLRASLPTSPGAIIISDAIHWMVRLISAGRCL